MLGGFLGLNALVLGRLGLAGAGPAWWYQNFVWPVKFADGKVFVTWHQFFTVFVHPSAGGWLFVLLLALAAPALAKKLSIMLSWRGHLVYYLGLACVLVWQRERVAQAFAVRDGGWTFLIPVIVVLQAGVSLAQAFFLRDRPKLAEYYLLAVLAALSLGCLLQYYPVPDPWHVLWSLAPAVGLFTFVLWRCVAWPAPLLAVILAAALAPSVCGRARAAVEYLQQPWVTLARPDVLRGMKVPPAQAHNLDRIMNCLELILRRQPDIPATLVGEDALFLCLTNNRTNATPYYVTWVGLADTAAEYKSWNYLLHARPLIFVRGANWSTVNDLYRRARYLPVLYVDEEALEIAIPQELADAMGLKAYGAEPAGPAKEKSKP